MNDVPVLEAIDAALSRPTFCTCGEYLTVAIHGDAAWLECPAFARPSRLPAAVSSLVRDLLHDSRLITQMPAPRPGKARVGGRVLESAGPCAAG
jgi:hypothetical protein